MEMREAFRSYFAKLWNFTKERYGTNPTVTYTDNLNKALLSSKPDEDEEIEWHPIEQPTEIEWDSVEERVTFELSVELKDYFGSYFFLTLSGVYNEIYLNFYPIDGTVPAVDVVLKTHEDAIIVFPESETFLIGNAVIDGDDSYFIYYDNAAKTVFCYDPELSKRVNIGGSLSEIIGSMEARD